MPHLISPEHTLTGNDAVVAGYGLLGYQQQLYGTDDLGNQRYIMTSPTGALKVVDLAFWKVTGSYYNYDYFISGVKAYGDANFFKRIIASKLNKASIIPAAYSVELNGSAEGGVAGSLSLYGGLFVLRGPDRLKYRSFITSSLVGGGSVGVSAQLVSMKYYYFGDINNFTLANTFVGSSFDIDLTVGETIVAGGFISIMFNRNHQGEFLLGTGFGAGTGASPHFTSGSITYNQTWLY